MRENNFLAVTLPHYLTVQVLTALNPRPEALNCGQGTGFRFRKSEYCGSLLDLSVTLVVPFL